MLAVGSLTEIQQDGRDEDLLDGEAGLGLHLLDLLLGELGGRDCGTQVS